MSNEILISIVVVLALLVLIGIKFWIYKAIKFKVDESAIVNLLESSSSDGEPRNTGVISAATGLSPQRVAIVCERSKLIHKDYADSTSWVLQR